MNPSFELDMTKLRPYFQPVPKWPVWKNQIVKAFQYGSFFLKSALNGGSTVIRDLDLVSHAYQDIYALSNEEWAKESDRNKYVLEHQGGFIRVDRWFFTRIYAQMLSQMIDQLGGSKVLEVGSGRGRNVIVLGLLRSDLNLTGLEYSANGTQRSNELLHHLPKDLVSLAASISENEQNAASLAQRITFTQGNAYEMPFPDKSFDISYTCMVLEQMPHTFDQAVREMRRVTKGYCIFIEPFREANGLLGKMHLKKVDYFRSSYKSFRKHGLRPIFFSKNFPQRLKYRGGILIAECE